MPARTTILAATVLAAILSAFAAAPAVARPLEAIAVTYQDLNLANPAGRDVLDRRIAAAARRICGDFAPVELRWRAMSLDCRQEAIASVRARRSALVGGDRQTAFRV